MKNKETKSKNNMTRKEYHKLANKMLKDAKIRAEANDPWLFEEFEWKIVDLRDYDMKVSKQNMETPEFENRNSKTAKIIMQMGVLVAPFHGLKKFPTKQDTSFDDYCNEVLAISRMADCLYNIIKYVNFISWKRCLTQKIINEAKEELLKEYNNALILLLSIEAKRLVNGWVTTLAKELDEVDLKAA